MPRRCRWWGHKIVPCIVLAHNDDSVIVMRSGGVDDDGYTCRRRGCRWFQPGPFYRRREVRMEQLDG